MPVALTTASVALVKAVPFQYRPVLTCLMLSATAVVPTGAVPQMSPAGVVQPAFHVEPL